MPTDCHFEIATSKIGQQLRLYRTNELVGTKFLFYAYDSTKNEMMAGTRKLFTDFFIKHFGFSDDNIVMKL